MKSSHERLRLPVQARRGHSYFRFVNNHTATRDYSEAGDGKKCYYLVASRGGFAAELTGHLFIGMGIPVC